MLDIDRIRRDTPSCDSVIHLNNAGSALPPRIVVDAMIDYLRDEESTGGYETQAARVEDLAAFYTHTASMLRCQTDEIAFVSSGSDSWWRAFSSVVLSPGDRILVSSSEFQSNAYGWLGARDRGVIVDVIPNTPDGDIDIQAFDALLDERVVLVSVTMVSMSNGAVQPVAAVGQRLKNHSAIFLVDACQAAGQLDLDVETLGCDFLVYTGRKFMRGPRGTGVLYARNSVIDRLGPAVFIDGGSARWTSAETYELLPGAKRFEFGEVGYAGKVGLAVATSYANDIGLKTIEERVATLADTLRSGLRSIDGLTVHDEGTKQCGIVTFTLDDHSAPVVQRHLGTNGINVSAPQRRNAQLDFGARGLDEIVRAGVHYYNTEAELDRMLEVVATL